MNQEQTKDKIRQLGFEIEQAERRKINCGADVVCREKNESIISEKKLELRHLEASLPENIKLDNAIDSDNNDYKDRQESFTYDKDCLDS